MNDAIGQLMRQPIQLPEPPDTHEVYVNGIAKYTRGENGWESTFGYIESSWQDIVDSGLNLSVIVAPEHYQGVLTVPMVF